MVWFAAEFVATGRDVAAAREPVTAAEGRVIAADATDRGVAAEGCRCEDEGDISPSDFSFFSVLSLIRLRDTNAWVSNEVKPLDAGPCCTFDVPKEGRIVQR